MHDKETARIQLDIKKLEDECTITRYITTFKSKINSSDYTQIMVLEDRFSKIEEIYGFNQTVV